MRYIFVFWGFLLLACTSAQGANLETKLMKKIELEVVTMARQTEQPQLTEKQQKELPLLLKRATQQVQTKLDLQETDTEEVILTLYDYLDGYNLLEEKATTEQELRMAQAVSKRNRRHALHFAVVTILPEQYHKLFPPKLYPEVTNWSRFYTWCRIYMDEFYRILEQLAEGNEEYLEEVFLIDPD